jgi:predicted glycosyltransferase
VRVLIAVTHLLGAGHLTRAAALARAFAASGHEAVLLSGGVPAPMVKLDGVRLVQLPPLRVAGTAFATPLGPDGTPADAAVLHRRRALMVATEAECAPDAVITELFPFGRRVLAAEFLALVEAARNRRLRPLVLASVRDILVASAKPERIAQAHARVASLYDAVLVHGDPALAPLDASWPLDPATAGKLRYTGYVDEGTRPPAAGKRTGILVAAGSGPAGLTLLRVAAAAARQRPDLGWRLLAGHGVPAAALAEIGRGLPDGVVERARPDYRSLLAGAALSVSQCGYNTAVDLLATGTPAVLAPFEAGGETEQRLRAERLAARGLARVLPEAELSAATLLQAVNAQLAAPPPPAHCVDLGGARRTVEIVEALRARIDDGRIGPVPAPVTPPPSGTPVAETFGQGRGTGRRSCADLDAVRAALDGAAAHGRTASFFWRDDDAVTATPALDRLLDLAGRHAVPILIAAIPAGIQPALGRRLDGAGGASVAIHGLAHQNYAPAGEKPAEFGPHRSLDILRDDAASGFRIARERLPEAALLPVFVPPWNRLAPALAAALPDFGYRGLSAVPGPAIPGLRRLDATLDPIDWRGTRSLKDPKPLLRKLAADIAAGNPVGLLTHHLAHDAAIWTFLEELLRVLVKHPAVQSLDFRRLFDPTAVDTRDRVSRFPVPQITRTA